MCLTAEHLFDIIMQYFHGITNHKKGIYIKMKSTIFTRMWFKIEFQVKSELTNSNTLSNAQYDQSDGKSFDTFRLFYNSEMHIQR